MPTLRELGEKEFTRLVAELVLSRDWRCPPLGPRDDAACLTEDPGLLLKIDGGSIAHSLAPWMSLYDLGWQWVAAAASDLAAKAAKPLGFVISLGLLGNIGVEDALCLVGGAADSARAHGAWLMGGDTNAAPGQGGWIDVAAVGRALPPWGPVGMEPSAGNHVYVTTGRIGLGWLALQALENPRLLEDPAVADALREWSRPVARLGFAYAAAEAQPRCLTAATDTSDGLLDAIWRLSEAAGAPVLLEELPPLHPAAEALADDPVEAALHGGQEYEIAYTVRRDCAAVLEEAMRRHGVAAARIGVVGKGPGPGVLYRGRRLPRWGWDQFAAP